MQKQTDICFKSSTEGTGRETLFYKGKEAHSNDRERERPPNRLFTSEFLKHYTKPKTYFSVQ